MAPKSICLYTPLASHNEFQPLRRSPGGRLKALLSRHRDRQFWRGGRISFDIEDWKRHRYTNRGDMAIRLAIEELLGSALGDCDFLEIEWGELDEARVAEINARCAAFVICGGGYIFLDGEGRANRRLEDVSLLKALTCPTFAFGIGLNALHEEGGKPDPSTLPKETQEKVEALAEACDLIGVRDRNTQELLQPIAEDKVRLIGDPALFLAPTEPLRPPPPASSGLLVGLNFAVHGRFSAQQFCRVFPLLRRFLLELKRERDCTFRYFLHCDTEEVAVTLLRHARIEVEVIRGRPPELISAYRTVDLQISQMLHSCILAVNAGTPVLNLAYDAKNQAFFELFGLQRFCIGPLLTLEALREAFAGLENERAQVAAAYGETKALLGKATEDFLCEIRDRLS